MKGQLVKAIMELRHELNGSYIDAHATREVYHVARVYDRKGESGLDSCRWLGHDAEERTGMTRRIEPFSLEWALKLVATSAEKAEEKHARRYKTDPDPHVVRAVEMVREHLQELLKDQV